MQYFNQEMELLLKVFPEQAKIFINASPDTKQKIYLDLLSKLRAEVLKILPELQDEIMQSDVFQLIDLIDK